MGCPSEISMCSEVKLYGILATKRFTLHMKTERESTMSVQLNGVDVSRVPLKDCR